jgi:RNA polymerase sigma-70 factor (ECF subfamily)
MSVEETLLRAARKGDGKAFGDLVGAHLPMLFRIAMRVSGDAEIAEDAVQETLTIAYKNLGRYQPDTSFRAFLAAIATKRAHTLIRAERRRRKREQKSAVHQESSPTPLQISEATQSAATLRKSLEAMATKRRSVVLLRMDAGLSYKEIARELGGTEESNRVLAHLAFKELKNAIKTSAPKP